MTFRDWLDDTRERYRTQSAARATAAATADLAAGARRRLNPLALYHASWRMMLGPHTDDVMDRDWDVLVLFDACRFDYFEAANPYDGRLQGSLSAGSESWEFMRANFEGRKLHDTVYVCANPHVVKLSPGTFHAVEPLLEADWDAETGTILPETVAAAAADAAERYPNKRLVVHAMQPHAPWLGPTADDIRERVDLRGMNPYHGHNELTGEARDCRTGTKGFHAAAAGDLAVSEVRVAYYETLTRALDAFGEFVRSVDGKVVLSADHGEHLGERLLPLSSRVWAHPSGWWSGELRSVPWFEVEPVGERREVTAEPPVETNDVADETVAQRLEALGYR